MFKTNYISPNFIQLQENLMQSVIKYLRSNGFKVQFKYTNINNKPKKIRGFTPTIYAIKFNEEIILEVETCKSEIFNNEKKWKRYSYDPRRCILIVPSFYKDLAEKRKQIFHYNVEICSKKGINNFDFI